MCGICGVIGGDPTKERVSVRAMAAAIAHRGPDGEGFFEDEHACLGNRRLAIIDLAGGKQPLCNEEGSLWITFNGEIYNYRELRAQLEQAGHRFRTNTDTEVVLHLFEQHGTAAIPRLRGMFAFAIWDRGRRRLFAARDRYGQKPLHYVVLGSRFVFASEIKGVLAHRDVSVEPEPAAIDYYLSGRFIPAPLTMIAGIRKLPAGHSLEWTGGGVRIERYWEPSYPVVRGRTDADWVAGLRERLDEAVRVHRVSDVPVGALLSGGIDSSVIAASMVRQGSEQIATFCVGSDGGDFDERRFARRVAGHLGTEHRESVVEGELLDRIPELVACLDEPSDPIAACMYEAARLAAPNVKVVLGGDGGDEVLAGFDRYAAYGLVDYYAGLPDWLRRRIFGPILRRLPNVFSYKSVGQRARWLDEVASERRGGRRYARMTTHFRFGPEARRELYGPALAGQLAGQDALEAIAEPFERAPVDDDLHRMLYADLVTRLPEHTLVLTDRMSMAHGLETRAPFLDNELAAFCASMPPRLKIRRGTTKFAMRAVAADLLPADIVRRAKQGFMFPVAYWLRGRRLDEVARKLREGVLVREKWIAAPAVERLVSEHRARRSDHHVRIWMLLNLQAWHERFLGRAMSPTLEMPARAPRGTEPAIRLHGLSDR